MLARVVEGNESVGPKEAKVFYDKLWKCLIDARTADRKNRMKSKIDHKKKLQVSRFSGTMTSYNFF